MHIFTYVYHIYIYKDKYMNILTIYLFIYLLIYTFIYINKYEKTLFSCYNNKDKKICKWYRYAAIILQ